VVIVIAWIPLLVLAGQRMKNAGYSAWLALLSFVPIVSVWIGFTCMFAPANYAQTKKLDAAAKAWLFTLLGLFVLIIIIAIAKS